LTPFQTSDGGSEITIAIDYCSDERVPPDPGTPIPDDDHVLRYIARKHVDNGLVNGAGFLNRPHEEASSVNWMECFPLPLENQVSQISQRRRLRYEKRAQLVRLNVGETRRYVTANATIPIELSFLHDPLPAKGDFPEDQSHALIYGLPTLETPEAELVKDLLADCVLETFAVVPDK
jgi:hypothetical protein